MVKSEPHPEFPHIYFSQALHSTSALLASPSTSDIKKFSELFVARRKKVEVMKLVSRQRSRKVKEDPRDIIV